MRLGCVSERHTAFLMSGAFIGGGLRGGISAYKLKPEKLILQNNKILSNIDNFLLTNGLQGGIILLAGRSCILLHKPRQMVCP